MPVPIFIKEPGDKNNADAVPQARAPEICRKCGARAAYFSDPAYVFRISARPWPPHRQSRQRRDGIEESKREQRE